MAEEKPKVAFYWCAGCGGCEEAVVDLAEDILAVAEAVQIAFWPVALDFKRADVEAMRDGELLAAFVNGSIRTRENVEMVKLLRRKAQLTIAFGACAQLGGVPGLANLYDRQEILRFIYEEAPTVENPERVYPQTRYRENGREYDLPEFLDRAMPLNEVVEVDYYIPGCAPPPHIVKAALDTLLSGDLPPRGKVLAADVALCHECPLNETKPEKLQIERFRRVHQTEIDPQTCLLAQGLLCLGPATRGGCEALCIKGHMPCTGCFGPLDPVVDPGGKMVAAFASLVDANEPDQIAAALRAIVDPAGTFYRYSLPASLLKKKGEDRS